MRMLRKGRVFAPVTMANAGDLWNTGRDAFTPESVRQVEVSEIFVDEEMTCLAVPRSVVQRLGFVNPQATWPAQTSQGRIEVKVFGPIRLTIQGRFCHTDLVELPEDGPIRVGRIPLYQLDWVVDFAGERLIGNPDHGGRELHDMY